VRIDQALPRLFERAYPAIDPMTPIISVLPLLRFHEVDALPLSFDSTKKQRGIFGYTSLARILSLGPKRFPTFLNQPCEDVSEPLAKVRADQQISDLLKEFQRARFGFARVTEKKRVGGLVSLDDILRLYENGILSCKMKAEEVSSKAFWLPPSSTVRDVLEQMFARRIRRVFVGRGREFVWDRSIIGYLFSPGVLAKVAREPSNDVIDVPVSGIEPTKAIQADPGETLKEAAGRLTSERGQCLVFDGRVVTPWDIVMKPWETKKLKIR
jgi:CBS domain-containing protein